MGSIQSRAFVLIWCDGDTYHVVPALVWFTAVLFQVTYKNFHYSEIVADLRDIADQIRHAETWFLLQRREHIKFIICRFWLPSARWQGLSLFAILYPRVRCHVMLCVHWLNCIFRSVLNQGSKLLLKCTQAFAICSRHFLQVHCISWLQAWNLNLKHLFSGWQASVVGKAYLNFWHSDIFAETYDSMLCQHAIQG